MSDKDVSRHAMEDTEFVLTEHFKDDSKVYVTANLLVYYHEGRPDLRVSPDVMVAKGVPKHDRETFKTWEEKRIFTVAFEFTSRSSRHLDPKVKVPLYERLGVKECYLFDPEGKWLRPRFRALRRVRGRWKEEDVSYGRIYSRALGLELRVEGDELRFYDPVAGQRLETAHERSQRLDHEVQRANQEAQRAEREAQRADQEAQRADQEAQRADQELHQRQALEARIQALEAENKRLRRGPDRER